MLFLTERQCFLDIDGSVSFQKSICHSIVIFRSKHFYWPPWTNHRRMRRGGHGLPKVSPGPALPYPATPCELATPKTALWPFLRWPSHRVGGLRPSFALLDTPRRTPMRQIASMTQVLFWGFANCHRCMAWGVQGSRRRPQALCSADGPSLKWPLGFRRVGLGEP
jgi:hypothetical protein